MMLRIRSLDRYTKRLINLIVVIASVGLLVVVTGAVTLSETQKLVAVDGAAYDNFGNSVAVHGDTALIGVVGDDESVYGGGAAYVFTREAGVWTVQTKLMPSDPSSYGRFGSAVAMVSDTMVIGAPGYDDNGYDSGAAYVFTLDDEVWTEQAKLLPSDGGEAFDHFGFSVAVDGDTAAIGVIGDESEKGSVYVFTRVDGVWTEQAKLIASDGESRDRFGQSVAVGGDTVIVGTQFDDDDIGAAYVFTRTGNTWVEHVKLLASDWRTGDGFGKSVALAGNTAIIGAGGNDDMGFNSGSAYAFTRTDGTWTEQAKLLPSDGEAYDVFGSYVALAGDTTVIGAQAADDNGPNSGSAYVFTRTDSTWTEQAKLLPSDGAEGDYFGSSVATDSQTAIVGAKWHADVGLQSGAAYVFDISPELPVTIDIKPGNTSNSVNPRAGGLIRVAILSDDVFDATDADVYTLRFGSEGAAIAHEQPHVQDVDDDGDMDLVVHFRIQQTGIQCGDTEATLSGQTWNGEFSISGTDSLTTVGCR